MNKKNIKNNQDLINELAERRTIEMLGMSDMEIAVAKAYETTKAVEKSKLQSELSNKSKDKPDPDTEFKELTMWDVLFRI